MRAALFFYTPIPVNYPLLQEVLALLHQYFEDSQEKEGSLAGFSAFLQHHLSQQNQSELVEARLNALITQDVSFLSRFMNSYMRKAIQGTAFRTPEDYIYTVSLLARGKMTKSELCTLNAMEKSTGGEVISRLLKAGIVAEEPNPNDRRSRLVFITPKGKAQIGALFPRLQISADFFLQDLTLGQKQLLHALQKQISQNNMQLYPQSKTATLEQLKVLMKEHQKEGCPSDTTNR